MMVDEITVLSWRMTRGVPGGVHIWFDPTRESVRLFRVPTSEQRSSGEALHVGVDSQGGSGELDKVVSMREDGPGPEQYVQDDFNGLDEVKPLPDLPF